MDNVPNNKVGHPRLRLVIAWILYVLFLCAVLLPIANSFLIIIFHALGISDPHQQDIVTLAMAFPLLYIGGRVADILADGIGVDNGCKVPDRPKRRK